MHNMHCFHLSPGLTLAINQQDANVPATQRQSQVVQGLEIACVSTQNRQSLPDSVGEMSRVTSATRTNGTR